MIHEPDNLFAALFDGTITDEQFDALSRMLEQDPGIAQRFAAWSLLEQRIHELEGTADHRTIEQRISKDQFELRTVDPDAGDSAVLEAVIAEAVATRRKAEIADRAEQLLAIQRSGDDRPQPRQAAADRAPKKTEPLLIIIPRWAVYAAATFLLAALIGLVFTQKPVGDKLPSDPPDTAAPIAAEPVPDPPAPPRFAARLIDQRDARWAGQSSQPETDGALPPGRYALDQGYLRVAFGEGVDSILHGPVQFNIDPDYNLTINQGKLWAQVGEAGVGFTVNTPTGRFVDLGTAFGVEVQPSGRSALHVSKGRVDAYSKYGSAIQPPTTTLAGQAVETTEDGRSIYPIPALPERFAGDWTQTDLDLMATGDVQLLHAPPPSLALGQLEHDDKIYVLKERNGVRLQQQVTVDITEPGRHTAWPRQRAEIATGQRVNSYLLHFDRIGDAQENYATAKATITFDQPIIAVITRTQTLIESDAALGAPDAVYDSGTNRGLEERVSDPTINVNARDTVVLSDDRMTLTVRLKGHTNVDHIRVITRAADPPAPNTSPIDHFTP